MKRFVFSLQALYNYKQTVEKLQKAELQRARQALMELLSEEQRLLMAYAQNERSLEKALREGNNVVAALSEHDAYFRFLRDALIELRERIIKAEALVSECQARLIITMKEMKTYDKLRTEQYYEYLKEVQAEEEKEMSDLVSFNTVSDDMI